MHLGLSKQKLLRALPRAQQFLRFTPWGPRGYWWGIGWGIEGKIAARAIFAIHPLGPLDPPMGPHGGIGGVLVIAYWLLPVSNVFV